MVSQCGASVTQLTHLEGFPESLSCYLGPRGYIWIFLQLGKQTRTVHGMREPDPGSQGQSPEDPYGNHQFKHDYRVIWCTYLLWRGGRVGGWFYVGELSQHHRLCQG